MNPKSKTSPANTTTATAPIDQNSTDFNNLVNLLAVLSEASNRLAALEAESNNDLMDLLDEHRAEYAKYQEVATAAETALETIALRNPAWFQNARSVKTPFGSVALKSSTELEIANEEATLVRLELHAAKNAGFKLDDYIRTKKEPNKEALEKLDDATLKVLGIVRVPKENFSAKPAKLQMGKALEKSAAKTTSLAA